MRADGEFFPGKNFHVYGNSQLIDTRAIKKCPTVLCSSRGLHFDTSLQALCHKKETRDQHTGSTCRSQYAEIPSKNYDRQIVHKDD